VKQRDAWYVVAWWSLVSFGDALFIPLKSVGTGLVSGVTPIPPTHQGSASPLSGARFAVFTLAHAAAYLAIVAYAPISRLGAGPGALRAAVFAAATGLLYGFFSQINHLNDAAIAGAAGTGPWAQRQVESSTNWATGSLFWTFFSNHLNFQIEHHLFPGVNHEHMPLLAPLVRKACKARGVKYVAHPTFFGALRTTLDHFEVLSVAPSGGGVIKGE